MATHQYRLWIFVVAALLAAAPATAQTPDAAKQAVTEKPAAAKVADPSASGNSSAPGDSSSADSTGTEAQPATDVSLSDEQAKLAAKYKELERVILRMAEVMQTTDPKRAALLRKTFAQSKEKRVDVQYEDLVKLLEQEQLYQASKGQFAVQQDLNQLLQLLLSGEREKQIPNERAQIKRFIERINKLIREEQGLQGETEGQGDTDDLIKQQEGVAKKTNELAQDLKKFDAETNPNPSENDTEGKDGAQGEKSDGKQGDQSGDKSPDAKKSDSKKSSDKDSDGKKSDDKKLDEKKSNDKQSSEEQSKDKDRAKKSDQKSDGKESGEKSDGKSGSKAGNPSDKKSDEQKSSEKPEAKNQDDKKSSDHKQDSQKSEGQKSDSQKSDGEKSDGSKQSGSPSSGKSKQGGKAQKGEGQQGQSEDNDDDSDQQSKSSDKQQSSDNQSSARKRIQQAEDRMRTAKRQLEQAKRRGAADEQQKAVEELKQAKAELEEILRQLREEEIERVLAQLEGRFRKMLQMQLEVYEGTMGLDRIPEDERDRDTEIEAGKLSRREGEITLEADKTLTLLHEEGSSVAFPESVEQMREDMAQTTTRLGRTNIGQITQGIEQDIIKSLEETIAALQKAQKDQKQRRGGGGGGGGKDQSLLDNIAELKMIRALQMRVNTRTERYSKLLQDGTERAETPDLIEAVQRLSEREQRIYKTTRDIVVGKNK